MNEALPGRRTSVWIATAPSPRRPALTTHEEADVAVIGAGIVGLTAAYLLKRAGLSVRVLDSGDVGAGVTGQTTAKVTSQHGACYDRLVRHHGEAAIREHAAHQESAIAWMRDVGRGMPGVGWTPASSFAYSEDPKDVARLQKEAEVAARLGLPASFAPKTELPFPVAGAVEYTGQAHVHPRHYALGLAAAVHGGSCAVHERSRVTAIHDGKPCKVETAAGSVTAQHVVVATHAPILDKAFYVTRMEPKREYGVAVSVAKGSDAATLRGMHVSVTDPRRSVRPYAGPDGSMLVLVGATHAVGAVKDDGPLQALGDYARRLGADPEDIRFHWSSQDLYPVDDLPLVGRFSPTAKATFAASGFRAWGMTQGTVAGHVLAALVQGQEHPLASLYDPFGAKRVLKDLASTRMAKAGAVAVKGLVVDRLVRGGSGALAPGEGRVEDRGLHKVAVCRTRDGQEHAVSASCPHMGCIVAWNAIEESWDCPCHGSRFGADGSLLHGPATTNLPPHAAK